MSALITFVGQLLASRAIQGVGALGVGAATVTASDSVSAIWNSLPPTAQLVGIVAATVYSMYGRAKAAGPIEKE